MNCKKKTYFNPKWLSMPQFAPWLEEVPGLPNDYKCKVCYVTHSLSNMGTEALHSHMDGKKHKARIRLGPNSIPSFFSVQSDSSQMSGTSASVSVTAQCSSLISTSGITTCSATISQCSSTNSNGACSARNSNCACSSANSNSVCSSTNSNSAQSVVTVTASHRKSNLHDYSISEGVSKAEILWCVQSVLTYKSLRVAASDVSLFSMLFPDSEIATHLRLQKDKISYISVYGLHPHFFELLNTLLAKQDFIVVGFDESFNKISKNCQMDVNVRFWSGKKVVTRYYSSAFLGRTRAPDLFKAFKEAFSGLIDEKKIIQVSMDGPNVNFKFLELLQKYIGEDEDNLKLLNLGSCGLHTVHNSFKTSFIAIKWGISPFLRACYNLFKESPARRALYTHYCNSTDFPLKFCPIRWLENVPVAERAIDIIPNLKLFIEGVKADKEEPNTYSYKVVVQHLNDRLLVPKLAFFKFLASKVEPFLREFQSDKPLAPFLHSSLITMLSSISELFVESKVLEKTTNLARLDVLKSADLISVKEINIGCETRKALRKAPKKISDAEILEFRESVRLCYQKLVSKLQEKSPLKYSIVKAVTCFDPQVAATSVGSVRFKKFVDILDDHNIILSSEGDLAITDYQRLCKEATHDLKSYKRYSKDKDVDTDLDTLWSQLAHKHLEGKSLNNFMKIVQIALILSHGNANLERGFSVNSEILNTNLREKSLIAKRSIYDYVSSIGGVKNLKITEPLKRSVSFARARYTNALKDLKEENKAKLEAIKRKKENDIVIENLKSRKTEIMNNALKEAKMIDDELARLSKE